MEIKGNVNKINSNAINAYKCVKKAKTADSDKIPAGKFDSVDIDSSGCIIAAKANIVAALKAEADIVDIRALQAKYAGGNPVPPEDVAKAILS
jgi:hypothetical protein